MDGKNWVNPFQHGLAMPPHGTGVSGGYRRHGGGMNNIHLSSSNGQTSAGTKAVAMEACVATHQFPQYKNTFTNFRNYVLPTQSAAIGWTNGGTSGIPHSSFIPLSTMSGGPLPHLYHANYSYFNHYSNATMHASFAPSRAMSVNLSIKQQYPLHNLAISSGVCSVNGVTTCTWPPVHYSAQSRLNAHAHSLSTATETPQSSHEEEFFLKDALRDFFAEGQSKDLTPFCQRIGKRRAKMSREINKHHFLKGIWNQRKKGMGFTKDQSVAASNYIDKY